MAVTTRTADEVSRYPIPIQGINSRPTYQDGVTAQNSAVSIGNIDAQSRMRSIEVSKQNTPGKPQETADEKGREKPHLDKASMKMMKEHETIYNSTPNQEAVPSTEALSALQQLKQGVFISKSTSPVEIRDSKSSGPSTVIARTTATIAFNQKRSKQHENTGQNFH